MAYILNKKVNLDRSRSYWDLLYILAEREIKLRYRGSLLGVYWSLFNPLLMTLLYTTIFGNLFKQYYHNSIAQYILAAFTGLTVIHFYQGSTTMSLGSVVSNGKLLNKIRLPVSVFPLSIILSHTFQLSVGMLPLLSIMTLVLSPKLSSIINVGAISVTLTALVLVCMGVSFLISSLYVFFRDLPFFYELVGSILWLSSPIFYPADIVMPKIRPLLELNPLYPIIGSLRQIVLSGNLPDMSLIIRAWLSGLIILACGWTIFNWLRPKFMDLL